MARRLSLTVIVVVSLAACGSSDEPVDVKTNSLVMIDPSNNEVVDAIPLGAEAVRLTYGDGAFWAVVPDARTLLRIDPDSRELKRFRIGAQPYDVAVGGGAAWVPDHDLQQMLRVDEQTGGTRSTKLLGGPAVAVGYGFGSVWAVVVPGTLVRIDPRTLATTTTVSDVAGTSEGAEPKLVFTDDALWIAGPSSGTLARVDSTGTLRSKRETFGILSATALNGTPWLTDSSGFLSSAGTKVRVGLSPLDVTAADGDLWVALYDDARVERRDDHGRLVASIDLPRSPVSIAGGDGLVGVLVHEPPVVVGP